MTPSQQFYSVTLFCAEEESDSYEKSCGVIKTMMSESPNIFDTIPVIAKMLSTFNEKIYSERN